MFLLFQTMLIVKFTTIHEFFATQIFYPIYNYYSNDWFYKNILCIQLLSKNGFSYLKLSIKFKSWKEKKNTCDTWIGRAFPSWPSSLKISTDIRVTLRFEWWLSTLTPSFVAATYYLSSSAGQAPLAVTREQERNTQAQFPVKGFSHTLF